MNTPACDRTERTAVGNRLFLGYNEARKHALAPSQWKYSPLYLLP